MPFGDRSTARFFHKLLSCSSRESANEMSFSSVEKLPSPQQRLFPERVARILPSRIKEPRAHLQRFFLRAPRFAGIPELFQLLHSPRAPCRRRTCHVTSLAVRVVLSHRDGLYAVPGLGEGSSRNGQKKKKAGCRQQSKGGSLSLYLRIEALCTFDVFGAPWCGAYCTLPRLPRPGHLYVG